MVWIEIHSYFYMVKNAKTTEISDLMEKSDKKQYFIINFLFFQLLLFICLITWFLIVLILFL
jgi:hypothetical protein